VKHLPSFLLIGLLLSNSCSSLTMAKHVLVRSRSGGNVQRHTGATPSGGRKKYWSNSCRSHNGLCQLVRGQFSNRIRWHHSTFERKHQGWSLVCVYARTTVLLRWYHNVGRRKLFGKPGMIWLYLLCV